MASEELEKLIEQWEWEADNDGMPPKITEAQKRDLAWEYLRVQTERKKIRGLPFLGLSEEQHIRVQGLDDRSSTVFNFIRESLMEGACVPNEVALQYINQVAATF